MSMTIGFLIGCAVAGPFGLLVGCLMAANARASRDKERRWMEYGRTNTDARQVGKVRAW